MWGYKNTWHLNGQYFWNNLIDINCVEHSGSELPKLFPKYPNHCTQTISHVAITPTSIQERAALLRLPTRSLPGKEVPFNIPRYCCNFGFTSYEIKDCRDTVFIRSEREGAGRLPGVRTGTPSAAGWGRNFSCAAANLKLAHIIRCVTCGGVNGLSPEGY